MNKERMLFLADYIEANPEHFDMGVFALPRGGSYRPGQMAVQIKDLSKMPCDSVCCIAGTAVGLWGRRANKHAYISDAAQELLGLSDEQAGTLFYGTWSNSPDITAREAASELRRLVKVSQ